MAVLPVEILQHICRLSAEQIATTHYDKSHLDATNVHFMSLLGFSRASWTCREVATPYLFRRIIIRTVEQASMIVPITYGFDTLTLIGKNLIPTCPKSLKSLSITIPGGQPDYAGPDKLLGALSSSCTGIDHPLSGLEFIHLSVQFSPQIASSSERLALGIARRFPALRHVSLVPMPKQPKAQRRLSVFKLIGSKGESQSGAQFRRNATSWRVLRDACTDSEGSTSGRIELEELQ
ncbi:hypothetical protein B0J17DRAFT_705872 [Rhizoctonia solani]|nr:hypothetical protein B0J17DRAFT_705872 [Rhizoctonia solani]